MVPGGSFANWKVDEPGEAMVSVECVMVPPRLLSSRKGERRVGRVPYQVGGHGDSGIDVDPRPHGVWGDRNDTEIKLTNGKMLERHTWPACLCVGTSGVGRGWPEGDVEKREEVEKGYCGQVGKHFDTDPHGESVSDTVVIAPSPWQERSEAVFSKVPGDGRPPRTGHGNPGPDWAVACSPSRANNRYG